MPDAATVAPVVTLLHGKSTALSTLSAIRCAHHNQKTTQQDPITKANRKAGLYREQEDRAEKRNDWMYEGRTQQ